MNLIKFEQAFHTFEKEGYISVPAWYGPNDDGDPTIITAYMPTAEEKEDIKNGKPIFLHLMGIMMPSVFMTTLNPFE
jgi:hypothetical protein